MERKCRYVPLAAQPLVLVLCQVRFSAVRQMERYIAAIQEEFRRKGFPIEMTGKVHQVTFGPRGGAPVQVVEQQRWEYRTKDERWSILVMQDSMVLQTTAYTRFEEFAEKLKLATRTVFSESEQDRLGVVHRVGLRYVDAVRLSGGKDYRYYLRPGLHGLPDEVFPQGGCLLHAQITGGTQVGGLPGTLAVRVVQNDQGTELPPDLVAAAPKFTPRATDRDLVTLIDMDHYVEGNFDADADWVVARTYEMHDHLIETFHEHVVTREAIKEWKRSTAPSPYGGSWYSKSWAETVSDPTSTWNANVAKCTFPSIWTSPGIDLHDRMAPATSSDLAVQPVAGQVREIQTALSVNKSELARILRVSRPTVYDWLDDGEPNAANIARIQQLLSLLGGSQVSSANPLFPQLVRHPVKRGKSALVKLLSDETLDEEAVFAALCQAKTMGDAIDRERRERENRLRAAGFEGVDSSEHKTNLASNLALMNWPRD